MITQTIYQKRPPESDAPWNDPMHYRGWNTRIRELMLDGRLISFDIDESTNRRTITMIWRDWEAYLDPLYNVLTRPILAIIETSDIEDFISTEMIVEET